MVTLLDRFGSLSRGLRRKPVSKRNRRLEDRRMRMAIDQLEARLALAITTPLSIGGTTVGSFLDAPTGVANQSDFVTVSIEGTKGTVIFNGGKGVADYTDIQTVEIVDASPDFQVTFSAAIQTGNAVPYGSDGVIQLGTITTNNVIRGINTVRGPLTNVAAPQEIETSAIHLYTFNEGTVSGSTVTDLVGGLDGTLFNGATVSGGQLVLADIGQTGANVQYMQMPADVLPQGSTAATFELWFTASAGTGIWGRGFDLGSGASNYVMFSPLNNAGGSRAAIKNNEVFGEQFIDGPTPYNDGSPHLATVTIDDATATMVYYIDGVQIGQLSLGDTNLSGIEAVNNFLGRSQFAQDAGFVGSINQFAIYDRALSSSEVAANFTAGPITGALSPIGFTQSTAGSNTLTLEGNQTATFPVGAFVCATPLLSNTTVGAPSFGTVTSVAFDAVTNTTTLVFDNTTAAGTTAGALTLAEWIQPEFRLTTFVGVNFSNRNLTEGGGIFVDVVQGGDYAYQGVTIPNLGILLTDGLLAYSTIGIRRELAAIVGLGPSGKASVDGRMFVESATPESLIFVGPQNEPTAKNSKFQLIGGDGEFGADVDMFQNFDGVVNLGGPATGVFDFLGNVGPLAVLNAQAWEDVRVAGNFAGTINSFTNGSDDLGDVTLDVRGNLTATARVNSESELRVNVGGSILKGAILSADQGTTFTVGGNVLGTIHAGSDYMSGNVGGSLTGATLASSNDITLAVAGSVVNSTLAADDEFSLAVGGSIRGSTITSGDSEITFDVAGSVVNSTFAGALLGDIGGNVTNSQFFAEADSLDDEDPDITLDVAGNMTNSAVQAASRVSVAVGGNVSKSRFISTTSGVTVDVGGSIADSTLIAADDGVVLDVGRDATNVKVVGDDDDTSVTVGRNFTGSVQSGSGDLYIDVGGSVLKASSFTTGGNAVVDVVGNFDGSVAVRDLRYYVDGNVSKASRIVAQRVTDWLEAGGPNFGIGGRFDGIVNVGYFDAYTDQATNVTIVGGGAGASARFYVDRFDTDTLIFNGNFRGNLRVLQDLVANLQFNGNVGRITIGGRVGSYVTGNTIAPVVANINVTGRLLYMNTNSYFQALGSGDGVFWNVPSTSNPFFATGSLFTGSYGKVVPTLQTQPLPGPTTPQTYTAPTAPTPFSAGPTTGPDGIKVSFGAPTSNGGLPVVYYEYTTNALAGSPSWRRFNNPAQGPGTDIQLTVDSAGGTWIPGNTYDVAVRAVNAIGSTATTSTPVTVPVP
jgi:hypothetical protein